MDRLVCVTAFYFAQPWHKEFYVVAAIRSQRAHHAGAPPLPGASLIDEFPLSREGQRRDGNGLGGNGWMEKLRLFLVH